MKTRLLSLLLIAIAVLSCKKEDETPTSKQLLTAHSWKLAKLLASGQEVTDPRLLQVVAAFSNSTILFKPDGTYTSTENNSGTTTSGTWELQSGDTQLYVNTGVDQYTFTIKELAANSLKLTTTVTVGPPILPVAIPVVAELQMVPAK